jgi:alkanesulfonate monooxygenase SsuD/methylene tetrahydromethanopterin reductase-like flavin-dependent oxidoreductase (luciferase family)
VTQVRLGDREVEDRAFGVGPGERVERLVAHLDVIKRALGRRPRGLRVAVLPAGRGHHVHPAGAAAASAQLGGGQQRRAVERAAEIGDTWIISPHATLGTIG